MELLRCQNMWYCYINDRFHAYVYGIDLAVAPIWRRACYHHGIFDIDSGVCGISLVAWLSHGFCVICGLYLLYRQYYWFSKHSSMLMASALLLYRCRREWGLDTQSMSESEWTKYPWSPCSQKTLPLLASRNPDLCHLFWWNFTSHSSFALSCIFPLLLNLVSSTSDQQQQKKNSINLADSVFAANPDFGVSPSTTEQNRNNFNNTPYVRTLFLNKGK